MTPVLKNNVQVYFILVNVIIALIYSLSAMLIVMSYRIKNKNYHHLWQISVLKICLPFLSVGFFGQTFLLLNELFLSLQCFLKSLNERICNIGSKGRNGSYRWIDYSLPERT